MNRYFLAAIFALTGIIFAFLAYNAIMWAVWGAPTHPIQYLTLFSGIGLVISAAIYLSNQKLGRWLALNSLVGIGVGVIWSAPQMVPTLDSGWSVSAIAFVVGYFVVFALAVFSQFLCRRGAILWICSLATAIGVVANTYLQRRDSGEFDGFTVHSFKWNPGSAPLRVDRESEALIASNARELLSAQGLGGTLHSEGSTMWGPGARHVILIMSAPSSEPKVLHYPKGTFVIYLYDGKSWITLPADAQLHPGYVKLLPDGMVERRHARGGISATSVINWQN